MPKENILILENEKQFQDFYNNKEILNITSIILKIREKKWLELNSKLFFNYFSKMTKIKEIIFDAKFIINFLKLS